MSAPVRPRRTTPPSAAPGTAACRAIVTLVCVVALWGAAAISNAIGGGSSTATLDASRFEPSRASRETPPGPPGLEVREWAVDGGTHAILVEDRRVDRVVLVAQFPVGRWSRSARATGTDRAFLAQDLDVGRAFSRRADSLGATLALRFGPRAATVTVTVLSERLDDAVALVRDLLRNDAFDVAAVRRRDRARRIEFRQRERLPDHVAWRALVRAWLDESDPRLADWELPAKTPRSSAKIASLRDAVVRRPGRVVGLAGDVDRDHAAGIVSGLLPPIDDALPDDAAPRIPPLRESPAGPARVGLPGLTQAYVAWGRPSVPLTSEDYLAFAIADHVLAGHFHSRLYRALRHDSGRTYAVSSSFPASPDPGVYGIATFTRTEEIAGLEETLEDELRRFARDGVTPEELADAVAHFTGRRVLRLRTPEGILRERLREIRMRLPAGFLGTLPEKASRIGVEDVREFARRWYDPDVFGRIRVERAR